MGSNHPTLARVFANFFTDVAVNYVYSHVTKVQCSLHYTSFTFILPCSSYDNFAYEINLAQRNVNHVDVGQVIHLCISVAICALYQRLHRLLPFTPRNSCYERTVVLNDISVVILVAIVFGVLMLLQRLHHFIHRCQEQDSDTCIYETIYFFVCLVFRHEVHADQLQAFTNTYFPWCGEENPLVSPTRHCTYCWYVSMHALEMDVAHLPLMHFTAVYAAFKEELEALLQYTQWIKSSEKKELNAKKYIYKKAKMINLGKILDNT